MIFCYLHSIKLLRRSLPAMLLAVGVLAAGCIKDRQIEGDIVRVGDLLPDFEVVMDDGTMVTDESLLGDRSVIMFFHTSCPDCRQLLPVMQRIYDEFSDAGVRFVPISRAEDAVSVSIFWAENGLTMPYSAQKDKAVYSLFAHSRVPRVYVTDDVGRVTAVFDDEPVPSYDALVQSLFGRRKNILK